MSNFERVDHLFLLIGKNPLPNYLATVQLLKAGGTAHLINTTDTETQAERLKTVLEQEPVPKPYTVEEIVLDDPTAYPKEIEFEITAKAKGLKGKIGLHYTGGTKVMSIHAYRAIDSLNRASQFSYLDSQSLKMCIEERGYLHTSPVTQDVSFETLFALHGIKLNREKDRRPSYEPRLGEVSSAIAQKIFRSAKPSQPLKDRIKQAQAEVLEANSLIDDEGNYLKQKIFEAGSFPDLEAVDQYAKAQ